jgi:penicillin-binding protein 2
LNTSLQGRYAKLGGLSETVKLELRKRDSILRSKTIVPKLKTDSNKSN